MIADEKENVVRHLAAKGLSERKIAEKTKIARSTITKILRRKPSSNGVPHLSRLEICPVCRYQVFFPCVVCGYRKPKVRKVSPYVDNLFLSIIYLRYVDFGPHTVESEDEWDDEYAAKHPWLLEDDP